MYICTRIHKFLYNESYHEYRKSIQPHKCDTRFGVKGERGEELEAPELAKELTK